MIPQAKIVPIQWKSWSFDALQIYSIPSGVAVSTLRDVLSLDKEFLIDSPIMVWGTPKNPQGEPVISLIAFDHLSAKINKVGNSTYKPLLIESNSTCKPVQLSFF